jgi:type I restriction enzyme S subunit
MYGATIGKVAILAEPAVTNQAVVACTPCDHLFNRYLFLFLLSQRQRFHQASEGGAQPNVSKAKVTRCPIPLPPLAEQHRIVAKVDELMALCDRLEAAQAEREARRDRLVSASLARVTEPDSDDATSATFPARFYLDHFARLTTRPEHVKQLRQTILNLAVRGRLVPQDLKDESAKNQLVRLQKARNERTVASSQRKRAAGFSPDTDDRSNRVPTGWVCAPLADIVEVRNGRAYSKNELLEKGTPVLRVGNLFTSQHWYFSDLALEPEKYCDAGDLLYAWSASFGPFLWPGPKAIFHYHIWNLVPHSRSEVSKEYLHRFLQTETARIRSAGHGISMLHMTKEKMERVTVPLPPLAEQQRIVAKVDELMVLCDQLEASLTSAATERARLLEALLHEALAPAA